MILCGIDNVARFDGQIQAERLAEDLFDNDFQTCLDLDIKQLEADMKAYADMTVAEGRIRLNPRIKRNLKAFVQWVKDEILLDRDPASIPFPIATVSDLIRRAKTHKEFVENSPTVSEAAKPIQFKGDVKWED